MAAPRTAGGPGGRGAFRMTWEGASVQRAWEAQIAAGMETRRGLILADLRSSIHVISGAMRGAAFAEVAVRGGKRTIVAGSGVSYAVYEEARHPQIRMVIDRHTPHLTRDIAAARKGR